MQLKNLPEVDKPPCSRDKSISFPKLLSPNPKALDLRSFSQPSKQIVLINFVLFVTVTFTHLSTFAGSLRSSKANVIRVSTSRNFLNASEYRWDLKDRTAWSLSSLALKIVCANRFGAIRAQDLVSPLRLWSPGTICRRAPRLRRFPIGFCIRCRSRLLLSQPSPEWPVLRQILPKGGVDLVEFVQKRLLWPSPVCFSERRIWHEPPPRIVHLSKITDSLKTD